MKPTTHDVILLCALFLVCLSIAATGCAAPTPTTVPTAIPVDPFMKMNPPADSDKPLPVPSDDLSCWLHTAANMLAGAGYGNGTTVVDRADDIWNDMDAQFRKPNGDFDGGWIDTALQWWLASANNAWPTNLYTVVTVHGNKTLIPWANTDGAREIGNRLRSCNMVGLSISWPSSGVGHAITSWGDDNTQAEELTANPGGIRVTDSDRDAGGDVQSYTYDAYTTPNPGGPNAGNGWYFNYDPDHPFIKHITTLERTSSNTGVNGVRVVGSYKVQNTSEQKATDLHYRVGTDVDILTYRTWIDRFGTPSIAEAQPLRELTVDWDLREQPVPLNDFVTITTEFVEPSWNAISYNDVHFTFGEGMDGEMNLEIPDLIWRMDTPTIDEAETIPNVTGGYVVGGFDVYPPEAETSITNPLKYRFVHQYPYNESPELHTFLLWGTPGYIVTNLGFGHSYGYPTPEELWQFDEYWMTKQDKEYVLLSDDPLGDEPIAITIDWTGQLPYPEGDRGTSSGPSSPD